MKFFITAAALGYALIGAAAAWSPAMAQPASNPKNPQIDVSYVAPKDAKLRPIHDKLRQQQVLETLQEFLAPLRLPRKLTVKADQCDALRAPYQPQGPVTICYEYLALIENSAPSGRAARIGPMSVSKELLIAGAFVHAALHEVAHAAFDMLQIPVWGNADDAADNVAGVIMVNLGPEVTMITMLGTSWAFAQRGFWGTGNFTDVVRSGDAQRFYNVLCVAYGAEPEKFAFLIKDNDLPKHRADRCPHDYRKLQASFKQTIMPHIDRDLLKHVQAQKWSARLGLRQN
jgi:hypothetical protein